MDNLLKVLALANYEVVYLVDYRKKQYRKILAKPAIDPLYPETGELNDAAMRTYLDSVLPEDRKKLIRETQPEHVLLATREHGKIIVPYRRLSPGGKLLYRKIVIIPHPDSAGHIFAIHDMT